MASQQPQQESTAHSPADSAPPTQRRFPFAASTNPFEVFRSYKPSHEERRAVEKGQAAFYNYWIPGTLGGIFGAAVLVRLNPSITFRTVPGMFALSGIMLVGEYAGRKFGEHEGGEVLLRELPPDSRLKLPISEILTHGRIITPFDPTLPSPSSSSSPPTSNYSSTYTSTSVPSPTLSDQPNTYVTPSSSQSVPLATLASDAPRSREAFEEAEKAGRMKRNQWGDVVE
ncbi:hypothetical protein M427DRAFT_64263 [Gonapodya prolifera JEL478]|uniref:Uncharacterized protein n=1 Tax=Gonapodya prolifera (strain JEL478) TaxID=1344416 RepID=A0A138ZXY5_GONPJ|nr:hypothetical protein M427DRAFT_64263 [Gonapodya prolifera JEL478]|eukprot:KXS09367.1 hypothetical protein M427DRAFT_64263 [Gonapodya prolifera JEL478]